MAQPLFARNTVAVALVSAAQVVLPGLTVAALLYVLARALDEEFTPHLAGLAALTWLMTALVLGGAGGTATELRPNPLQLISSVFSRWAGLAVAWLAIGHLSGLAPQFPRDLVLLWLAISPLLVASVLLLLRALLRSVALSRRNRRNTVVVGVNPSSLALAARLREHREFGANVLGFFDDRNIERLAAMPDFHLLGRLQDIATYVRLHRIELIFVTLPIRHIERVVNLLDDLRNSTASIYYMPDIFVFDLIQSTTSDVDGIPVIALCETPFYGHRGVQKRMWDIGMALVLLVLALPVMLVISALIALTSRGPVIFRQRRYGLDGEEIIVYKFRTMRVTEDGGQIMQASRDDPRVTPVGRVLRRLSLDELPQLVNVLQGRMSIVGPRPHAVAHNELYRGLIKGYMVRHKVRPGMTGWAQVHGYRGETQELSQMEARVAYDLEYMRKWSPSLDLKILLMTVQVVFGDKKAY